MNDNSEFLELKYHNLKADIVSKNITDICSYKDIADRYFLSDNVNRIVNIQFLTPTTYKVQGNFTIFPYIDSMFISLYDKWNMYSENISLQDDRVVSDLVKNVNIIRYDLRSTKFSMEGVNLNSFIGNITLHCSNNKILVNIYNMLLDFAFYSGIGAKTSLSMGGVLISRPYIKQNEK